MRQKSSGFFVVLMALVLMSCPNPTVDTPIVLTPSTITFADGAAVSRQIGSGNYTNAVSGDGTGAITYSSATPGTATVNETTGEVTLVAIGSTVITASKAETVTHAAVSESYTLTVTALTPSTIVFADGTSVSRQIGSGNYINAVSGDGTGAITYSSATPGTATVNETTGEVTLVAVGSTVITATKAATATFETVTNTYTLTVTAIPVTFSSAVQVGGVTNSVTTSSLTLTFSVEPTTLAASDITVTGATKGDLSGTGASRSLAISAITVANGETVSVSVASPSGFAITGSPQTAVVYKAPTAVAFTTLTANGTSGTVTTTALTLTFDVDPATLATSDITVTGATKGALSGTGLTRSLTISAITVTNGDSVTVTLTNPAGFTFSPATKNVVINTMIRMATVPAGSYQRDGSSLNISTITQPFRMSQHEITRAQFLAIMGTDPSNSAYSSGTTDPVQMVNWYHAIAFCNKLSIAEGLTPVYAVTGVDFSTLTYAGIPLSTNDSWNNATATWTDNGYRLPTEMEWMWAAMGATGSGVNTTDFYKAFAGSTGTNAIGDFAVFGYNGSETGRTTTERSNPVGSKTSGANELNLFDMSGNVLEWCWDWYGDYPAGTVESTSVVGRGATSGTVRVMRGGSWGPGALYCTVAYRDSVTPHNEDKEIGFRVVRP
jgi:formylglycine-generating enzyme